ncbi:hypothetical protein VNO80_15205 [Phaseolus coccineus]|uniref:AGC-kinase C-terminal domain-containing protein n=1 Tax=Phaseolus coccineus TaxID=3886 RepID=A0AAN9QZ42_PHACN
MLGFQKLILLIFLSMIENCKAYLKFPEEARLSQKLKILLAHPFFKGVEWDKLYHMEAAFIPDVNDELDAQNFEKFDESDSQTQSSSRSGPWRKDATSVPKANAYQYLIQFLSRPFATLSVEGPDIIGRIYKTSVSHQRGLVFCSFALTLISSCLTAELKRKQSKPKRPTIKSLFVIKLADMIDCESETPEQELSDTSAEGSFLKLLPPQLEISQSHRPIALQKLPPLPPHRTLAGISLEPPPRISSEPRRNLVGTAVGIVAAAN